MEGERCAKVDMRVTADEVMLSGTTSEISEITMCGGSGQDCIGIPEHGVQMVGEGLSLDWPETRLSLQGRVFWARTNQLAAWREQALHLHRRLWLARSWVRISIGVAYRTCPADPRKADLKLIDMEDTRPVLLIGS